MTFEPGAVPPPLTEDGLDRLFHECTELETLITSIRETIDRLDPAIDSGLVTAEHLMNLAFRIERAEQGMIAIANQLGDTATSLIERRPKAAATAWPPMSTALGKASEWTKN